MFEHKIINIQRYFHRLNNKRKKSIFDKIFFCIFSNIYVKYLALFYNAYIPPGAKIGRNLHFNHSFYNIFISEHSIIGDNCTILQNTTIGSNQPLSNDAPIIGHNVFIGVNCNIIGKVTIGDNCIIGAGTTIAKGVVPNNSKVVGQNYRIINGINNGEK